MAGGGILLETGEGSGGKIKGGEEASIVTHRLPNSHKVRYWTAG
jgi:hypothetical protein